MSDLDEHGFYVGDEDERRDALEARRSKRFKGACRCGTDMPGRCPGPENCPMCQEDDEQLGNESALLVGGV